MYRSRVSYETKLERDEGGGGTKKRKKAESREIETKGRKRERKRERGQEGKDGAEERVRRRVETWCTERTTRVRTPTGQARHIQLALPRVLGQLTSSSSAAGVT